MSQETTQATFLDAVNQEGCGVRVEFKKSGDRFSHALYGLSVEGTQLLLETAEGTPEEISPASPPFAELHRQEDMLFLTGATTLGHWSMSVQAVQERLLFDVACRIKSHADRLGSTYMPLASGYVVASENAIVDEQQGELLQVTPSLVSSPDFPKTIQWQYTICFKA